MDWLAVFPNRSGAAQRDECRARRRSDFRRARVGMDRHAASMGEGEWDISYGIVISVRTPN